MNKKVLRCSQPIVLIKISVIRTVMAESSKFFVKHTSYHFAIICKINLTQRTVSVFTLQTKDFTYTRSTQVPSSRVLALESPRCAILLLICNKITPQMVSEDYKAACVFLRVGVVQVQATGTTRQLTTVLSCSAHTKHEF